MIRINQEYKIDKQEINKLLTYGIKKIKLNERLISDDIEKLENIKNANKLTQIGKINLENTINYLTELKSKASKNNGIVSLDWRLNEEGEIESPPIYFKNLTMYNINTTDYVIRKEEETIIDVDLTEIYKLIAFEMAYKDLGWESLAEIEKQLKNLSIIAIYDHKEMKRLIPDNILNKLKVTEIKNSEYAKVKDKIGFNYINCLKPFYIHGKTYDKIVNYSYSSVTSIVASNMLKDLYEKGVNERKEHRVRLCAVTEEGLQFSMINIDDKKMRERVMEIMSQSVIIRILGRKFESIPALTVY